MPYPSTFSLTQTRDYYGSSRVDPQQQPELWSSRPPSGFYNEAHPTSDLLMTGGVAAGIFASGYLHVGGRRMWDRYVGLLRGIEEYSPGGILRTFQLSTFFSQFTTPAARGFHVGGEFLRGREGRSYAYYLSSLIGGGEGVHQRVLPLRPGVLPVLG